MVLQAFEGLSDREAVDRLGRDLAWQAACGVDLGFEAFDSTVLVGIRNRPRGLVRPKRFLDDTRVMARRSAMVRQNRRLSGRSRDFCHCGDLNDIEGHPPQRRPELGAVRTVINRRLSMVAAGSFQTSGCWTFLAISDGRLTKLRMRVVPAR